MIRFPCYHRNQQVIGPPSPLFPSTVGGTRVSTMQTSHRIFVICFLQLVPSSANWVSARNINFYNVIPQTGPTPFPNSFKCFTCENAVDNYNCNRWAEDKWCPENTRYCLTVHHFASHGRSRSVTKKCATKEECRPVGCHHYRDSGHTECISCCEGMICNIEVPTNHTNAVFSVMHAWRTSDANRRAMSVAVLTAVMTGMHLL